MNRGSTYLFRDTLKKGITLPNTGSINNRSFPSTYGARKFDVRRQVATDPEQGCTLRMYLQV